VLVRARGSKEAQAARMTGKKMIASLVITRGIDTASTSVDWFLVSSRLKVYCINLGCSRGEVTGIFNIRLIVNKLSPRPWPIF
jgi:hypothetical protein